MQQQQNCSLPALKKKTNKFCWKKRRVLGFLVSTSSLSPAAASIMYKTPQIQTLAINAESFVDKNLLGETDEGRVLEEEEDVPMLNANSQHQFPSTGEPSLPGLPIDDFEGGSLRSVSVMSCVSEPPNARNYFERIPSPNLNINSNFSRPPYLTKNIRRSGANTPTNGYRSANEVEQRREQQRQDNPQLPRSASFNTANRSNYNVPPPIRNSYNQQFAPPLPPSQQEPYIRNDQYQRYQDVQANRHSGTQNSYNTLNSQHFSNQEPYINDQGYRTIPPQSFHSEPRRDRYDNWMPNYEQYRPRRRVWRPPVTNNFNFINVPFNHQFYGYPQQAQQMIDYAQSAASMATLRTSFQHDYNIARNTQRIITVKEEDEDDGDVVYVGTHQKNPKLISSKRKRKSSSTGTSSSSPQGSDESVTIETASNSTLTSQVPSKQSRSDSKRQQWPRSPSSSSAYSLEPNPFSSAPELTTYQREVQTPIPEMIGLKISTVSDAKVDDDVEDGEIVAENDCAKIFPTKSEIPLDRLPEFMPKPAKEIESKNEEHNTSVVSTILPPSHPDYNPLLDDFDDDGPTTFDASSFALDDEDDLLNDYDAEAEKKAQEDEDHVLKKFPDLKLTDNSDDHMNE